MFDIEINAYCLLLCGITVYSAGHSMANLEETEMAANNGASLITHLFNAMLPVSAQSQHGLHTSCTCICVHAHIYLSCFYLHMQTPATDLHVHVHVHVPQVSCGHMSA